MWASLSAQEYSFEKADFRPNKDTFNGGSQVSVKLGWWALKLTKDLAFLQKEGAFLLMEWLFPLMWSCPLTWRGGQWKPTKGPPPIPCPRLCSCVSSSSSRAGVLIVAFSVNSGPVASPSLLRKNSTEPPSRCLCSPPVFFGCTFYSFSPLSSFLRGYFRWEECRLGLPVVRDFPSVWSPSNVVRCCWMWGNEVETPLSVFHPQHLSSALTLTSWALNQLLTWTSPDSASVNRF